MKSISSFLKSKLSRIFFFLTIGLVVILSSEYFFYNQYQKKGQAIFEPTLIEGQNLNQSSVFEKKNNLNFFSLYGKDKIYSLDSNQTNLGMSAFINKDIQLKRRNNIETVLPKSINQELVLVKKYSENEDQFLKQQGVSGLTGTHFFYQQKISGLFVYGAFVNMHLKENNQLYGLQGSVIENGQIPVAEINDDQAQTIALDKAKNETKNILLNITQSEKLIFNKKLLGISEDDKNYIALAVTISSKDMMQKPFSKKYFVDLVSREVIFEENSIREAVTRNIYDFRLGDQAPPVRAEGSLPTGETIIDNTYNILGEIYDFYLNNFNRKSYDNQDSPLEAIVHVSVADFCPNAIWSSLDKAMFLCDGMVTRDIIAHELTHGINTQLMYSFQSGALAESLSDIMAVGLDNNWTMGEGSIIGIIRYVDDPPRLGQPDKLFSNLYGCAETADSTNDSGYIHKNDGITNKAFHLMVQGGSFNNCQINGIGMEKALAIIYHYMTVYLSPTENFKNAYNSIIQSCNDIYQVNSDTCNNVKRALLAVEIDQQPANIQVGAKCLNINEQTPICNFDNTPSPTTLPSITPILTGTPTPSPTGTIPTTTPAPTPTGGANGNIQLDFKISFQGITKKPGNELNKIGVTVTVVKGSSRQKVSNVIFVADDSGNWKPNTPVVFDQVTAGSDYYVLVKGDKHIQKKICDNDPGEDNLGLYRCDQGKITLNSGNNILDFSKILLLAGDLPEQDGIVNSYDLSLVRNNLGKKDAESIRIADINLDGVVDTQDFSLIIAALSTRTDEI